MPALTLRHRQHTPLPFQNLPFDVLAPILSHLTDRRDWHACCLVSKAFSRIATPFLYRTLDSRRISNKNYVHHASSTILKRPDLAHYVRHVTETVSVHRCIQSRRPRFTRDTLTSLSLCKNLNSMTWIDDSISTDETLLLAFITVLRRLPLKELTIRTHNELGEAVWTQLTTLTGLSKISLWCMEGPPRTLQGLDSGWAEPLGSTLTHLELGVSAFCYPPTELLSHLPLLRDLRLKGAPASSIQTILGYLPNLQSLDTEYLLLGSGSGFGRWNAPQNSRGFGLNALGAPLPLGPAISSSPLSPASNSNSLRNTLKSSRTPSAPHSVWTQFGSNSVPALNQSPADFNFGSPSFSLGLGLGLTGPGLGFSGLSGGGLTSSSATGDGILGHGAFQNAMSRNGSSYPPSTSTHPPSTSLSSNWITNSNSNHLPSHTRSHPFTQPHAQRQPHPQTRSPSQTQPPSSSPLSSSSHTQRGHPYSNPYSPERDAGEEEHRPGSPPSEIHIISNLTHMREPELPALRHLTVRTSVVSSLKLWTWIRDLVPGEGLETFRLHALSYGNMRGVGIGIGGVIGGQGLTNSTGVGMTPTISGADSDVPRQFIVDLARLHGPTLREFNVGEATLSLEDVYQLSTLFPMLEVLVCGVTATNSASIVDAIAPAKNLQSLRLHVQWIKAFLPPSTIDSQPPTRSMQYTKYLPPSYSHSNCPWHSSFISPNSSGGSTNKSRTTPHALNFTLEDAKKMMTAHGDSKLRVISIGHVRYAGKWELEDTDAPGSLDRNDPDASRPSLASPSSYAVTSSNHADFIRAKRIKLSGSRSLMKRHVRASSLRFVVSEEIAEDHWRT